MPFSVSYINDVVCSLQKAYLGEVEYVMDCPRLVLIMNYLKMETDTCLVEGPSPLGHLLVLEIRSGARAISLGKFQNIPSSTGCQV